MTALSHLACARCETRVDPDTLAHLCPACNGPLFARYDLERAARTFTRDALRDREPSLWRYDELLPLRDPANRVSLGESMTPVLPLDRLSRRDGMRLAVKDDGLLPTGSFKTRGAAVGVSRARELGVRALAMPTNGNAGGAWAAYGKRAGIRVRLVMPERAPSVNRLEAVMTGADVALVDGTIADAGKVVLAELAADPALYDAGTLREPYRIEGKKTIGLELIEQYGWEPPDVVVYPTGGGVGLIGIHKAFEELRAMGLVTREPRLVVAQSTGCAPVVRAFEQGAERVEMWPGARTVAFGITVPKPLGDVEILRAVHATGGTAIAVDDDEILARQRELAETEGIFVCPEGGACYAAALALRRSGWIATGERVLLINTATGLKYPETPFPTPPSVAIPA